MGHCQRLLFDDAMVTQILVAAWRRMAVFAETIAFPSISTQCERALARPVAASRGPLLHLRGTLAIRLPCSPRPAISPRWEKAKA